MYDDVLAKASSDPLSVTINPEQDTGLMLYTGGTTGVPKGAELSHTNIAYNCLALYEWARFVHGEGSTEVSSHIYGRSSYYFCCLCKSCAYKSI